MSPPVKKIKLSTSDAIVIADSDNDADGMDVDGARAPSPPVASTSKQTPALLVTGRKAWLDDVATFKTRYGCLTTGPLTRSCARSVAVYDTLMAHRIYFWRLGGARRFQDHP
jgi:hypothetical protein